MLLWALIILCFLATKAKKEIFKLHDTYIMQKKNPPKTQSSPQNNKPILIISEAQHFFVPKANRNLLREPSLVVLITGDVIEV